MTLASEVINQTTLGGGSVQTAEAAGPVAGEFIDEVRLTLVIDERGEDGVNHVPVESSSLQFRSQRARTELLADTKPFNEIAGESVIVDQAHTGEPLELGLDDVRRQLATREQRGDFGP